MRIHFPAAAAFVAAALSIGCNPKTSEPAPASDKAAAPGPAKADVVELHGAGATFPYPLYSKWFFEYGKAHPDVRINYQSIGSGGGIRQILERTVDFGASDAPMTAEELAKAPGKLLHVPMTLGAVVVTYNVPGVEQLQLSPALVSSLFLGEIKRWNDPRLGRANPGQKLPDLAVTPAYRSDGSGTTAVFTDYLAKVSAAWKDKVGAGKSVKFPAGMGAKGNEGVTGVAKTTPGTIAYVELAYAQQNHLPLVTLQNAAGKWVAPALESISAAAAGVQMPDDFRVSITDAKGEAAYPISAFTYLLVYQDQPDAQKGKALFDFLRWAVHEGQALGGPLHYAALPAEVVTRVDAQLKTLMVAGKPAL